MKAVTRTDVLSFNFRHRHMMVAFRDKDKFMWYFAWLLGLPLAAAFAVLNAMWYELMDDEAIRKEKLGNP